MKNIDGLDFRSNAFDKYVSSVFIFYYNSLNTAVNVLY